MENEFYIWFYGLSVIDNRNAKKSMLEFFAIPSSTFYTWLKPGYKFSKMQMIAMNQFAQNFNGTTIFGDDSKTSNTEA